MTVDSDRDHSTHRRYTELFGSDEVLAIAIQLAEPTSPSALQIQSRIAEQIEALPAVVDLDALVTADDIRGSGDALVVEPLVPDPAAASSEELLQRIRSHPVWPKLLLSSDEQSIALHVTLTDSEEAEDQRGETLDAIDEILATHLEPGSYHLAGHPFMKREIANAIAAGLATLLPVTLILMAGVLLAALDWLTGALVLALVIVSVSWMLGLMGWMGVPLTAVSNCAPAILLALSTAALLHLPAALRQGVSPGNEGTALEGATAATFRPVFVAGATTVAGFSSLTISSVQIIRDFGLALAIGMVCSTVVALVMLPAGLKLRLRHPSSVRFGGLLNLDRALLSVSRFSTAHPLPLLTGAIVLAAICVAMASQLEVDSSGPNKFPPDSRFRKSAEFYRQHFSGDVLENIYLSGPPGTFADPDVLAGIGRLEADARALPEVDHSSSVRSVVMLLNREFSSGADIDLLVPASQEAISQLLLIYESERGDLSDLVSADYSDARIALQASVPSSSASAELRTKLERLAQENLPSVPEIHVVSTEILLSRAADLISVEQIKSAFLALVVVLVLVALFFRSIPGAAILILPNVLPILMNLACMYLMGIALSDATSIIAATTIGIAVDSSVHLLARATDSGAVTVETTRRAVVEVGPPIATATLVVVLGFSALATSDFRAVQQLGVLTAATMAYCLAADLLVLPAELSLLARFQDRG
jgi:predicted RND superfamily exporter protein